MKSNWVPVVVRFRNGETWKCKAQKYFAHTCFSVQFLQDDGSVKRVPVDALKAVFYVKSLETSPHGPLNELEVDPEGFKAGRIVTVTFYDGEKLRGRVLGNLQEGAGFFLFPTNPASNNERVFVIRQACSHIVEES